MKVCIVLGTRPEIIKCAPIIRECQKREIPFILIHSGQHYSYEMDQIFFEELNLPKPNYALEVGSDTHGRQTARILEGVEEILLEERPHAVLVQGDTNTVIAGALAAAKLHIPVGHVEAGLRSYFRVMPEELNRLVADVLADHLFVPTEKSKKILLGEGVDVERIEVVGNTVVDATLEHIDISKKESKILEKIALKPKEYFLVTSHRPENVDDKKRLSSILEALVHVSNQYKYKVVWPIHPRTEKMIEEFDLKDMLNDIHGLKLIKPIGYFDSLMLQSNAKLVLTDSGGIQEEACILGTPCVTLRDNTERPESIDVGANRLAGVGTAEIITSIEEMIEKDGKWENPFGDGTTAKQIIDILVANYDQKEE
jgi:UDP-N-acetylglucosamine 2-epimerase (non-hydrolysing)